MVLKREINHGTKREEEIHGIENKNMSTWSRVYKNAFIRNQNRIEDDNYLIIQWPLDNNNDADNSFSVWESERAYISQLVILVQM